MNLIKQALDAYANSARKIFPRDRAQTVGASEIGQCIRKIFWLKNEGDPVHGVERDPEYAESWGARMRGTVFEDAFWEPALRKQYGNRLMFAGKDQKTFSSGFLSATPDGMIGPLTPEERDAIRKAGSALTPAEPVGNCVMVECKTADPRTNLSAPKHANVFQTQVQMGLMRDNSVWSPTHSILSYTDASFWSETKEFAIAFDERIYETAKQRATTIMTATGVDEVPPEGWIAGGHECRYCPFLKPCGVERRNLPFQDEPIEPQFAAEMRDMAVDYKARELLGEENDAELRRLQTKIKSRLREKGVRKIPGVLTWSNVKGRPSYDNKAIREAATTAGVDVERFQTVGEPTDRLAIQIASSEDETMPDPAIAGSRLQTKESKR